jgi:hypothetical protein
MASWPMCRRGVVPKCSRSRSTKRRDLPSCRKLCAAWAKVIVTAFPYTLSVSISPSRFALISSAARFSAVPVLSSTRTPLTVPRMIQFGLLARLMSWAWHRLVNSLNVKVGKNIRASRLLSDAVLPCNLADFLCRNREGTLENKLISCTKSRPSFVVVDRHDSVFGPRRRDRRFVMQALHLFASRTDNQQHFKGVI